MERMEPNLQDVFELASHESDHRQPHLIHQLSPGHSLRPISHPHSSLLPTCWISGLVISSTTYALPPYTTSPALTFSFCSVTLYVCCQVCCHLDCLGSGSLPDERSPAGFTPALPEAPARMCLHTGFQSLHFSRNQGLLINPGWNLLWNIPESWNKPKGLLNSQQGKMPFNWLGWLHCKNLSSCYAKLETNLLDCLRNLPAHPDQNLPRWGVCPTHKQDTCFEMASFGLYPVWLPFLDAGKERRGWYLRMSLYVLQYVYLTSHRELS